MKSNRKLSTYARLLQPGDRFWTVGDSRVYVVTRIETTVFKDTSTVTMGDRVAGPLGNLTQVRVWVENRTNPMVFDGADRVNLIREDGGRL